MPISLQKMLDKLFSPAEQAEIRRAGAKIAQRHLMLHELRKARKKTQAAMAKKLKINQVSVSRLENRADLLVSTLSSTSARLAANCISLWSSPNKNPLF
jgi:DNA-binding XRE family transcriptional regulator